MASLAIPLVDTDRLRRVSRHSRFPSARRGSSGLASALDLTYASDVVTRDARRPFPVRAYFRAPLHGGKPAQRTDWSKAARAFDSNIRVGFCDARRLFQCLCARIFEPRFTEASPPSPSSGPTGARKLGRSADGSVRYFPKSMLTAPARRRRTSQRGSGDGGLGCCTATRRARSARCSSERGTPRPVER